MRKSFSSTVLDWMKLAAKPGRELTKEGAALIRLLDDKRGWRQFLPAVGPSSFQSDFAPFHNEFWDWYWALTYLRKNEIPISNEVLSFLLGWGRGNAKSTAVEWACLIEGMVGLPGYVLYVSLTQLSAESHVAAIRKRLESARIAEFFPDLAEPKIGKHKNRYGWRQNFLQTSSGWAIRPVGLDAQVRGLKEEDLRPSMIVFDDIDSYKMSPDVVNANLDTIARDILPAGTENTIQLIANNLIGEHTCTNLIATGQTSVLSEHVSSIHPAFDPDTLDIQKRINRRSGEAAYEILHCDPIWKHFDIASAKKNLNKIGLEAFMAEYQHDFSLDKSDRTLPEYDPAVHVISWSQFKQVFPDCPAAGYVPKHWQIGVGLDVGFTDDHLTSWSWIGVSAEDSRIPNLHFRFRVRTFQKVNVNDQAQTVLDEVSYFDPNTGSRWNEAEQYVVMKMSHEALNERMILVRDFELLFTTAKFGKEDGISQWRSLLRVDKTLPHPFHQDEFDEVSQQYRLGRPNFFDIVMDASEASTASARDMALAKYQAENWRRVKPKITSHGLQAAMPMKFEDDVNDSTRMILAEQSLGAAPLTALQQKIQSMVGKFGKDGVELKIGYDDYMGQVLHRAMVLTELMKAEEKESDAASALVRAMIGPPSKR